MMNNVIENSSRNIILLISGYISVLATASNTILMNLAKTLMCVSAGFMQSSLTFIGREIGKQDLFGAKRQWKAH